MSILLLAIGYPQAITLKSADGRYVDADALAIDVTTPWL